MTLEIATCILLAALFFGAIVQGLSGFAFSAQAATARIEGALAS